jgi:leucyl aminopeptidase
MHFELENGTIESSNAKTLVVAIYQDQPLAGSAEKANELSNQIISSLIESGDFKAKKGETLTLHKPQGLNAERLVLVGLGKNEDGISENAFIASAKAAAKAVSSTAADTASLYLTEVNVKDRSDNWKVEQLIKATYGNSYVFDQTKSEKAPAKSLKTVSIQAEKADETIIARALATAKGIEYTKTLGNLPGNVCTPSYLADEAKLLADASDFLSAQVLEEAEMESLGMGSLLSVSAGSEEPAKLIVMEYNKNGKGKPHVLVGKGITFDTGGISLKPGAGMDEMKWDMCGAGTVFGVIKSLIELQPDGHFIGVVAAAENMPSGKATKPGDVVTTMSGQTVEILNTDAEGRLVLCDALTYVEKFDPASVIDIATLTGACVVALGHHPSAVYANDDDLSSSLVESGLNSWDRVWPMPLWEEYQEELDSNFADMANIGSRWGGSITAACFLSRFTKKFKWAHLDIAGTAWTSGGKAKGSSGRPVSLLVDYLLKQES